MKNASQDQIDQLLMNALVFGLSTPSSVNEQLRSDGFNEIDPCDLLIRAKQIEEQS